MASGDSPWPERKPDPSDPDPGGEAGSGPSGERPSGADRPPPRRPPRGLASRDRPPRPASRYTLFVGLAFVVLALIAVINAITTDEGGVAGADAAADRGVPIPQFAIPDVRSTLTGDANIDQDDCDSERNPCPEGAVRTPACEIEVKGAIRACDLFDRPLAISFWFTRGGDCLPSQDAFDAVAGRRKEEVNFLSVNSLDDREDVEAIVAERGWEVPVGADADGAVSNIFGIGVCPSIVLAYPGGVIHAVEIKPGNFEPDEIDALVDELLAASERRGRDGAPE